MAGLLGSDRSYGRPGSDFVGGDVTTDGSVCRGCRYTRFTIARMIAATATTMTTASKNPNMPRFLPAATRIYTDECRTPVR